MVCEIVIECQECGKVVFGNSMYPHEVPEYISCPACGSDCVVISKQLVNHEVVISIEKPSSTVVGKAYGKGKGGKRTEDSLED